MGLESVFKLSLIMNMIDNLTSPMARVTANVGDSVNTLQKAEQGFTDMTKTGSVIAGVGMQIEDAVLKPVEATFETKQALGELSTLGVKDLNAIEDAATSFSDQWAGTSASDFITAAYDIKSGINSLTDEGVAKYTELAGVTAKGTKSTIAEMTSLFASGYNIYKGFYKDLSDEQFGEMFAGGIAQSVKQFKTTGSGMADAIQMLGASATTSNVPLEEQLSILGMLQSTMSGSEAGTKYKAFIKEAATGGKALGLNFMDANNQLLSLPQILDKLRGKFGTTLDAAEKMKIQQAFGDEEAVSLIDLMYNKTGDLQKNITTMYGALGNGVGTAKQMADAINQEDPDKFQVLQQRIHNTEETIGNELLPTYEQLLGKGNQILTQLSGWISKHQELAKNIMLVVAAFGAFLTVGGSLIAVIGATGLIVTRTAGFVKGLYTALKSLPELLETLHIVALYAGDGLSSLGRGFLGAVKSVWSFTAALLANPITWIVLGIIVLTGLIILLATHWKQATAIMQAGWNAFVSGITTGFNWVKNLFARMPAWLHIALAVFLPFVAIPLLIITHWGQISTFFENLWKNIANGAKTAVNFVIGALDGLSFKVPAWVPGIGGSTFGFKIPKLAQGGIVDSATPFIAGEAGREAILPLENNTGWIDQLAQSLLSKIGVRSSGEQKLALGQDAPKKADLGKISVQTGSRKTAAGGKDKATVIQKLVIQVDFSKIKDLPLLTKLLREIEDYAKANGGDSDETDETEDTGTLAAQTAM